MNKRTRSRLALVALTAALGLGNLGMSSSAHATASTGTCSAAGTRDFTITHDGLTTNTLANGAKLLVPTTSGTSGVVCIIDGASWTVVSATASTGEFEIWKGGTSAAVHKFYRVVQPA